LGKEQLFLADVFLLLTLNLNRKIKEMLVASLPTLAAHPIQSMFEDRPSRNYYGLCPKIWVTQCFASVLAKIMIPSGNLLLRQDPMACP
jgi:hypothetical protein